MRLDSANRSFLAILVVALLLGAFVLCGALGGVLIPLMLARASHDGGFELSREGWPLLAAVPFVVVVVFGLTLGVVSLLRQLLASRALSRRVRGLSSPSPRRLVRAAKQTGLEGRIVLVNVSHPFSFVYGLLTPRVVMSRGLVECATPLELLAVLEHERYHVANLDPLKLVCARSLAATLFFLPAFEHLRGRYVASSELGADRRAVAICGRRPLAGALLKVAHSPGWSELDVAAHIGGPDLLDVRTRQLETGIEPTTGPLGAKRSVVSLAGVISVAAMFGAAALSLGGPAAIHQATGAGLITATLLGGLACVAPFAGALLLGYLVVVMRVRLSLGAACP